MSHLSLDFDNLNNFIPEISVVTSNIQSCHEMLERGNGPGSDFLGWMHPAANLVEIERVAKSLRDQCEVFIVIGIGGSYIGAQAGLTFLKSSLPNQLGKGAGPDIYFPVTISVLIIIRT